MGIDDLLGTSFTSEVVPKVIHSLPNGKASGFNRFTYEHIKNEDSKLLESLMNLYRNIMEKEYITRAFKLPIKIPIPKGGKLKMTFDDSRGIKYLSD